ncbi:apolipoprotein N-acyltransferase [Actinomyces viscosus]|uniref:apolipoprotein N-acyltransferase n=1 Tax=Actinomyces viscosus TaxID=1656 RepID=UPI0028E86649|nr:apolipoprotein N-acyltransferase [Actinomyces viscosus]
MALLAGLATYTAFPPISLWWSALIGVGALMLLTRGRGVWSGTGLGLLYGFGLFTPLLHFTMVGMGNPIGWIALTLFESLYLAGLGGAWALVSHLPRLQSTPGDSSRGLPLLRRVPAGAASVLAFALLWSGFEELRSVWPLGGFPFGRLAFAMADAPVLPAAAYVGSAGVGLLVALAAGCLAHAARRVHERRAVPVVISAAAAACLLTAPQALPLHTRAENGTVRVGAVQGNVATDFEDAFNRALEVTGNHAEATRKLAADVGPGNLDMVIWPENSADLDPRDYPASAAIVDEAAQAVQAPVLVGAVPFVDDIRYNDLLVWSPGDVAGQTTHPYYRKHRPVPFAEYIPARSLVRRLTTQVDRVGIDMLPGTGPSTLTVPAVTQGRDVTFAMGICFEVAYDDALRTGVKQGGQAIVIPTNNASFLDSGEAAQQLAQGRVQAVVHGRSVIQASTVGYTAIINPRGEVEQVTRPYTQASLVADVPLRSSQTVADRLGPAPGLILLAGAGALLGAGILGQVRLRRKAAAPARRPRR